MLSGNHMTCQKSAGGCGFEFCWMCMGSWQAHQTSGGSPYSCNKRPDPSVYDEDAAKNSKAELAQFTWAYSRYLDQRRSQQHAADSREKIKQKAELLMDALGETLNRLEETEFMLRAIDTVVAGRRATKWGGGELRTSASPGPLARARGECAPRRG